GCRRMNNFNTLLAIISGLNMSPVTRLKQTWEIVDAKRKRQLQELESLVSPEHNYKQYRTALSLLLSDQSSSPSSITSSPALSPTTTTTPTTSTPTNQPSLSYSRTLIPILSLYLKDLLFINDGNKKFVSDGLINFAKLRMIHRSVAQFMTLTVGARLDSTAGSVLSQVDPNVVHFAKNLKALKEVQLIKYSNLCETKDGVVRMVNKWNEEEKK
ncbi:Rap guanine nucleotide exchange factor 6, partial [Nowakowskiella sp. JEL0407]